jgi:hypothetical protein
MRGRASGLGAMISSMGLVMVEAWGGLDEHSPKGAGHASPGQRPGKHGEQKIPALKGRPNAPFNPTHAMSTAPQQGYAPGATPLPLFEPRPRALPWAWVGPPFQGLGFYLGRIPRALPWAGNGSRRWRCRVRRLGDGVGVDARPGLGPGCQDFVDGGLMHRHFPSGGSWPR